MLERLNEQSQGFQNMQDEAENRINNFDIEHQMYTGAAAAYRLGHEQLGMNINNEQRHSDVLLRRQGMRLLQLRKQ